MRETLSSFFATLPHVVLSCLVFRFSSFGVSFIEDLPFVSEKRFMLFGQDSFISFTNLEGT